MKDNPYRTLQVDPCASTAVIRAAYRELARVFHPDVGGDPGEMKRINAAWAILGDPKRRAAFDSARAASLQASDVRVTTSSIRSDGHWSATPAATASDDHAGPPPGHPSGPVLTYGRYKGWSLGEIARMDRRFIEWFKRTPAGRAMARDVDAALRAASAGTGLCGRPAVVTATAHPWSLGGRVGARA